MLRDLNTLYVAISDNELVCFETNLNGFVDRFSNIEPKSRNYAWFYRSFRKSNRFEQTIGEKVYYFQKVK